jgi:hypothetical protein
MDNLPGSGTLRHPSSLPFSGNVDVLSGLDGRRTFSLSDSMPQLTAQLGPIALPNPGPGRWCHHLPSRTIHGTLFSFYDHVWHFSLHCLGDTGALWPGFQILFLLLHFDVLSPISYTASLPHIGGLPLIHAASLYAAGLPSVSTSLPRQCHRLRLVIIIVFIIIIVHPSSPQPLFLFLSDPNVQLKSLQWVPQPNGTNLFSQSSVCLEPLHLCRCEGCRVPKTVMCSVLFYLGWINLPLLIN